MTICIIPARGGSKGVPGKNIRPLAGKPLLAYSVEQALATPDIERVFVSTNSHDIAAVARDYGAEIIWRPAEISGDMASSESALLHALDHVRDKEELDPDLIVFLQATSPLRRDGEIQEAIDTLRREEADSLLSVGPMHGFVWRNGEYGVEALNYDYQNRPRRQDAPEDLIENGSIYVFKPWVLREEGNRLGGKIALHRMRALESFQIDDPEDFELIELILGSQPPSRQVPDFSGIELLVLDFDGVFTDNRVLVDEHGKEAVLCHRGDGLGLEQVRETGLEVIVLSKETNPVVTARCEKLGLPCQQSCDDKRTALQQMAAERGLEAEQIAFMGNDVNDVEGLRWAGVPLAVADAVPAVREVARYVTVRRGGEGAVREVCDLIMKQRAEVVA
jgi:N-acylneuraminate cytidylyltransferase